jgi:hypothetical protein
LPAEQEPEATAWLAVGQDWQCGEGSGAATAKAENALRGFGFPQSGQAGAGLDALGTSTSKRFLQWPQSYS